MSQSGWVKLHRSTLDNPIVCKDAEHLMVWIYLLLNVTHEQMPGLFEGKKIMLEPGQIVTGRKAIAFTLRLNEHKVQRVLKAFEIEQQIAQQTCNQNRLITVLNWSKYQECAQQDAQPMHNDCTADAQQMHTYKKLRSKEEKKNINILLPGADAPDRPAAIVLPLCGGGEYPVWEEQVQEWGGWYPAVDVMQELRKMKGWLVSNPKRKKTERGMMRFITAWLSREQDRGHLPEPKKDETNFLN